MKGKEDYTRYYNLEEKILPKIRENFENDKRLTAFDFFCIISWKSNRPKKLIYYGLKKNYSDDIEKAVELLVSNLKENENDKKKQLNLLLKIDGIGIAVASAILSVLYPKSYTIYDYRVCKYEELNKYSNIKNKDKNLNIIEKYLDFLKSIKNSENIPGDTLKKKDEWLWGRSFKKDLWKNINEGFPTKFEIKIMKIYSDFFKDMKIDKTTATIKENPKVKFATYPYIGSNYGRDKKIVFVGLDIGSDEKPEGIQSFAERKQAIEGSNLKEFNEHIAGTYLVALYFLKEKSKDYNTFWETVKGATSFRSGLINVKLYPEKNPLSYVALTNYWKFVDKGREHKRGEKNRKFIREDLEDALFYDELKALKPDIIIFQSKGFKSECKTVKSQKWAKNVEIYIGPHPSYYGKKEPAYYVKTLLKKY